MGGLGSTRAEEIDRGQLSELLAKPSHCARHLVPQLIWDPSSATDRGAKLTTFLADFLVVDFARGVEETFDLVVGEAVDEPRFANRRITAALEDLAAYPLKILVRGFAARQRI